MAGILDFLTGNDAAASPWGMLYQQPAPKTFIDYSMGFPVETPASPFGDPSQSSVANPTAPPAPVPPVTGFGAGATPFGFAGPGSMSGINPAMMAGSPAPAAPQVAQQPAPPATDLSSVNRAAPAPADEGPDSFVPVGNYKMPMFGDPEDAPAAPAVAARPAGAPAAPAPFSLGGAASGVGDRLGMAARGFMGNMGAGPIGALMAGAGSLLMGRESDPTAIARGNVNATGQALLKKGAPLEDVQAAVTNPTLMQSLIQQYYGKDKFKIVQTGENENGKTFSLFNETDGTIKPLAKDSSEPGGVVAGPDGKPITIPPGVNRKEFIKQVTHATADAATGKKTEAQAKASSFAARMEQADSVMGNLQNEGLSLASKARDALPGGVGNLIQTKEYQKYNQAKSAFITALLRQESGAAINKAEFDRYEKEMFPQPGDDPSVVAQKGAMRKAAIEQMRGAAGPGYHAPGPLPGGSAASGTVNVGGKPISWKVN